MTAAVARGILAGSILVVGLLIPPGSARAQPGGKPEAGDAGPPAPEMDSGQSSLGDGEILDQPAKRFSHGGRSEDRDRLRRRRAIQALRRSLLHDLRRDGAHPRRLLAQRAGRPSLAQRRSAERPRRHEVPGRRGRAGLRAGAPPRAGLSQERQGPRVELRVAARPRFARRDLRPHARLSLEGRPRDQALSRRAEGLPRDARRLPGRSRGRGPLPQVRSADPRRQG